jgi:sarcosine oxidase
LANGYDVIVLGLGIMGGATVARLSNDGHRVLGLDANQRGHHLGASHGSSRIIREAIVESPDYVPLVRRSFDLWRDLETRSAMSLLTMTGRLNIGTPESGCVTGALASARLHDVRHERLNPSEVAARFPGFRLTDDLVAVFEPNAGALAPGACLDAFLGLATAAGADLHFEEPALSWTASASGVTVTTPKASYQAQALVITSGAWTNRLLPDLHLPLETWRVVNAYFTPATPDYYTPGRCPVYRWQVPEGDYYGFPAMPGEGVKLGRHDTGERCTPETVRRDINAWEIEELRQVLVKYMPGAAGPAEAALTCLYTNTPDRHFVVDRHPEHGQVVYACGFSGHGFKYAPVIGEILTGLATTGATQHQVAFLSASRPALAA